MTRSEDYQVRWTRDVDNEETVFLTFVRWPGQFAANVTLTGIVSHEDSKIGTFSDALMTEANKSGWTVVSMKDDWKTIYPPAETGKPAP